MVLLKFAQNCIQKTQPEHSPQMSQEIPTDLPISFWLKSNRILTDSQVVNGYIGVHSGKISAIQSQISADSHPVFDCGNSVIMTGLVDPHVHINEPGRTEWEGFETATKAAAAGGITTLIEMPLNASPVTTNLENFNLKLEATKGKLWANCGFWGGLIPENANDLDDFLLAGVFGLKAFLTHSGIDEFPNVSEADLRKGMTSLAQVGLPILAHCELESPNPKETELIKNPFSYQAYLASRPDIWEVDAVRLMINLCRETGAKTHIVHVASAECLPLIRQAKLEGLPLTAETCPQYLVFNAEEIPDGDTRFKCAPPIRKQANNQLLWEALKDGTLDFVASDHSPAPPDRKEMESGNLQKAWGGISGLQFGLPLIWTFGQKHGIDLIQLAQWLCEKPAHLPGLENKKGRLAVGFDADLVIWNPESRFIIEESKIFHKHKMTPYSGLELKGIVKWTLVGGKTTWFSGQHPKQPAGKCLLFVKD